MKLVMNPKQFDVLLLENLYGDIISDLASGLVGGLGITPGANLGTQCAVFRVRARLGTRTSRARASANPTALLLSATMLLRHIGEDERAARIEKALNAAMADGSAKTRDVGGTATTAAYAKAVIARL